MSDALFEQEPLPDSTPGRRRASNRRRPSDRLVPSTAGLPFDVAEPDGNFAVLVGTERETWTLLQLEVWALRSALFAWHSIHRYLKENRDADRFEGISDDRRAFGNTSPAFDIDAVVRLAIEKFTTEGALSIDVVGEDVEKTLPHHVGHVILGLDAPDGTIQALLLGEGWAAVLNVFTIDTAHQRRWRCLISINAAGEIVIIDRIQVRRLDLLDFAELMRHASSTGVVDSDAVRRAVKSAPNVLGSVVKGRPAAMHVVASKKEQVQILAPLQIALYEFEEATGIKVLLVPNQAGSPAAHRVFIPATQLWWVRKKTRPCDSVPLLLSIHPAMGRHAWLVEEEREVLFTELIGVMEKTRPGDKSFAPYTIAPTIDIARGSPTQSGSFSSTGRCRRRPDRRGLGRCGACT